MKKLLLILFVATMAAIPSARAQTPSFADRNQHFEFRDGKTEIVMHCRGAAATDNVENGFGRHYETIMYVTNARKENYFQGTINKDTWRQVSAKRTSKFVFAHYVWSDGGIIKYDLTNGYFPNYRNCHASVIEDDDTIDLCGLLFLVRSGTPARDIQAKTLLTDNATMPLSGVTIDDGGDDITFAVTVGKDGHVAGRIRKDEGRTPEYLDIDIPGFATTATLVEYSRRVSLNH